MSDRGDYEALLQKSWEDFCDGLKAAGSVLVRDQAPKGPVDRAAAFRLLSRNIALALAFELENDDPRFPELMHYFDPIRKQGGDQHRCALCGSSD